MGSGITAPGSGISSFFWKDIGIRHSVAHKGKVGGSKIFILDLRFLDPNGAKNSLGRPLILNVKFSRKKYPFTRYSFLGLLRSHSGF